MSHLIQTWGGKGGKPSLNSFDCFLLYTSQVILLYFIWCYITSVVASATKCLVFEVLVVLNMSVMDILDCDAMLLQNSGNLLGDHMTLQASLWTPLDIYFTKTELNVFNIVIIVKWLSEITHCICNTYNIQILIWQIQWLQGVVSGNEIANACFIRYMYVCLCHWNWTDCTQHL
jgi:hypothetical protein